MTKQVPLDDQHSDPCHAHFVFENPRKRNDWKIEEEKKVLEDQHTHIIIAIMPSTSIIASAFTVAPDTYHGDT